MHHLLFKQKHLFGMLSILSVRAWTGSIQQRLDIVINTSGGRLLHLPARPPGEEEPVEFARSYCCEDKSHSSWDYGSHKWME